MKAPLFQHLVPFLALAVTGSSSCVVSPVSSAAVAAEGGRSSVLRIAETEANWKERPDQPYAYLEHVGDYRTMGPVMRRLLDRVAAGAVEATGPPFALFYDDPGRVAAAELRARVCVPVDAAPGADSGLGFDVLGHAMVVYRRVAGAYPDAPRVYPSLFRYLAEHGWKANGPVREMYLVNPAEATSEAQLVTEVQIPWTLAR